MYYRNAALVLFFLFSWLNTASQENWSYDELKNAFYNKIDNNDSLAKVYAYIHLAKAKKDNDVYRLADSYIYMSSLSNLENAIKYCDSAISLTKSKVSDKYPATGFMMKGYYYYDKGKDKEATESYLKAYEYALQKNNTEYIIYINNSIANLKAISGQHDEAIEIYKQTLKAIESSPSKGQNHIDDYLYILDNLSKGFLRKKALDSASIYINKGIKLSDSLKRKEFYHDFILSHSSLNYFKKNYRATLDSLEKIKPFMKDLSLSMYYYYKGKINKQNNQPNYIINFQKIDSIYKVIQISTLEIRDSYKILFDYYTKNEDKENQLKYIVKLLEVDSLITNNNTFINYNIEKKYDIPNLKKEKTNLEQQLKKSQKHSSFKSYVFLAIILIFSASIFFINKKQRHYKKLYQKIISKLSTKQNQNKTLSTKQKTDINISETLIQDVLDKLKIFEKEKGFLENGLTLVKLAKKLNTNSAYLSKIINYYKNQSFSNYLNSLKVDYSVKELSQNTKFRKFTINAISNEVGFNTPESFSKAFFKEKGIYPSYFIKQLNKEKLL